MVEKLSGPNSKSATALSAEVGVSQATLSRWLKGAATVEQSMSRPRGKKRRPVLSANAPSSTKRPQDWTAEEKVALVLEAAAVPADELGAFLRRKGIHEAQLSEWR